MVKLTWTEESNLKAQQTTNLIKQTITKSVLGGFDKYDFWFMRYKDVVTEGYEKSKDMTMYEEKEEGKDGQKGGGGFRGMKF